MINVEEDELYTVRLIKGCKNGSVEHVGAVRLGTILRYGDPYTSTPKNHG